MFAGIIKQLFVSREPDLSQKCFFMGSKITLAGRMWLAGRMLPPPAVKLLVVHVLQAFIFLTTEKSLPKFRFYVGSKYIEVKTLK